MFNIFLIGIIIIFILITKDDDDDLDGLPLSINLSPLKREKQDCNVTITPCFQDEDCLTLCKHTRSLGVLCEKRRCKYVKDEAYCLNGGEFHWHGEIKMCACLDSRFYGPRCEWKNPFRPIKHLNII